MRLPNAVLIVALQAGTVGGRDKGDLALLSGDVQHPDAGDLRAGNLALDGA